MKRVLCFVITFVITLLPLCAYADATVEPEPEPTSAPAPSWFTAPADQVIKAYKDTYAEAGVTLIGGELNANGLYPTIFTFNNYSLSKTVQIPTAAFYIYLYPFEGAKMHGLPLKNITGTAMAFDINGTRISDCHIVYLVLALDIAQYPKSGEIYEAIAQYYTESMGEPYWSCDKEYQFSQRYWSTSDVTCMTLSGQWNKDYTQLTSLEIRYACIYTQEMIDTLAEQASQKIIDDLQ